MLHSSHRSLGLLKDSSRTPQGVLKDLSETPTLVFMVPQGVLKNFLETFLENLTDFSSNEVLHY